MNKSEPYFVHIGYTYACERRKTKKKVNHRYLKLSMRPVVEKRLAKLRRYWRMALK